MLPLQGKSILIVEDQFLVARDVATVLKDAGASATIAPTAKDAFPPVVWGKFAAAILDQGCADETGVCARLKQMNVPVVVYSGNVTKTDLVR
jgi:DNA-binding response OmpR family regulator